MFKRKMAYSRKDVERIIEDYENMLNIQKRDIEYLKNDNLSLKSALFEANAEIVRMKKN